MTKKDGSILFEDLYLYSGFLFLGVLHGCTLLILTGRFICVPSSLFRFFIVCLHHKFLWKEYNWALILNWKSLIIIFILLTTISYYMTEKANKGIWCISFSLISIWQDFFNLTFKLKQYSNVKNFHILIMSMQLKEFFKVILFTRKGTNSAFLPSSSNSANSLSSTSTSCCLAVSGVRQASRHNNTHSFIIPTAKNKHVTLFLCITLIHGNFFIFEYI